MRTTAVVPPGTNYSIIGLFAGWTSAADVFEKNVKMQPIPRNLSIWYGTAAVLELAVAAGTRLNVYMYYSYDSNTCIYTSSSYRTLHTRVHQVVVKPDRRTRGFPELV